MPNLLATLALQLARSAPMLVAILIVGSACAESMSAGAGEPDGGGPGEHFGSSNDGDSGADGQAVARAGLCPTSECPAGRVTCPNNPYPCGVDLSSDDFNCGACGHSCPSCSQSGEGSGCSPSNELMLQTLAMTSHCVNSVCQWACLEALRDCNGYIEDGCETSIVSDRNNCGECGHACPDMHECVKGICVCEIANSCGACGDLCSAPSPALPPFPSEWHAAYGCVDGECNRPACISPFADCNGDFPGDFPADRRGDGCESRLDTDENCLSCGRVCGPGERCQPEAGCVCECGNECFEERLKTDTFNCGGCQVQCLINYETLHSASVCNYGTCDNQCLANWADCDGKRSNGCETNVASDPLNCGACGARCEGIDGQACVAGECTMKECGSIR